MNDITYSQEDPYVQAKRERSDKEQHQADRKHFAAMAMQGMLCAWGEHDVTDCDEIAHDSVLFADALIAALEE